MSQKISTFPDISEDNYKIKTSYIAGICPAENIDKDNSKELLKYENVKINIGSIFYTKNEIDRLIGSLSFEAPELKVTPNRIIVSDSNGKISASNITQSLLESHIIGNDEITNKLHITAEERAKWNNHIADKNLHITADERKNWNDHLGDKVSHITADERKNWNAPITTPFLDYTKGKTIQWDTAFRYEHYLVLTKNFSPKWIDLKRYDETQWEPQKNAGFSHDMRRKWSAGNDLGMDQFYGNVNTVLCARSGFGTHDRFNYESNKRKTVVIPSLSDDHMYFIQIRSMAGGVGKTIIHWRKTTSSNNNITNNNEWKYIGTYYSDYTSILQLPMPKGSQIALTAMTVGDGGNNAAISLEIKAFPFLKA